MSPILVTTDWLVYIASALLSLAFSFIPKLNTWYAAHTDAFKKWVMLGLIFLVLAVVFALSCANVLQSNLTCTVQGALDALVTYIFAIAINQGIFKITPQLAVVKAAKMLAAAAEK